MATPGRAQQCRFMAVVICQMMWPWGEIDQWPWAQNARTLLETLGIWIVTPCQGGHGSQVGEVRRPGVSRETTLPS